MVKKTLLCQLYGSIVHTFSLIPRCICCLLSVFNRFLFKADAYFQVMSFEISGPWLPHGVPGSTAIEVIDIDDYQSSTIMEANTAAGTSTGASRKRRRQNSKPGSVTVGANPSCDIVDLSSSSEDIISCQSNQFNISKNSSSSANAVSFRPHFEAVVDLSNDTPERSTTSHNESSRSRNLSGKLKVIGNQEDVIDLVDTEYSCASTRNVIECSTATEVEDIDDVYSGKGRNVQAVGANVTLCNPPPILSILDTILEVYPDCDIACANQLCSKHGIAPEACASDLTAARVALLLEEMSEIGYTKAPKPAAKATLAAYHTYDFTSTSWEPPILYKQQVYGLLMNNFPFLSAYGVRILLSIHKNHYAPSHKAICDALIQASSNDPLVCLSTFAVGVQLGRPWQLTMAQQHAIETLLKQSTGSVTVKLCRKTKNALHGGICPVLQQEVLFVEDRQRRFHQQHLILIERERAHKVAVTNGTTIECGCCYGDFALEEMCQCQEGHLFCIECLQRYAQEQVFGQQKAELVCLATTGQCTATFDRTQLLHALPAKVMEKYDEASFLANLLKANIDGLCKCPKCEFSAILPETENIFFCPNVQCRFESCRFCGEESHIPLRCSEVEKKSDIDARKSVEEAMANARIRECPTCHKRFFKEEGCNKMTCACGTKICYVCRVKINDYTHFCQQPHCSHNLATCNKCPLYSNSVEEDKDAVRRAASRGTANVPAGSEIAKLNVEKLIQSVSNECYRNNCF